MAHNAEPMDVDSMDSDFDNKENTYLHSNVLPCTEKGYEELDVSELNMKLRYSMTPVSSPMSKSYTASLDNRNLDTGDSLNCSKENSLTRSLNSTMVLNDNVIKSIKSLPLQSLPSEQFIDGNGNASVLRQLENTVSGDTNITVTITKTSDIDENLSLPSTSSSALHTPEATTPTKEIAKDGGSPILRGLKSVLNMFRSSQSPIVPGENDDITVKQEELSPVDVSISENVKPQAISSTPIAAHRAKDGNTSKRSSPYKDSIVFNDDLEKELNWKDETTIIFSHEKIPVHKLFFQNTKPILDDKSTEINIDAPNSNSEDKFNTTVEYINVSYCESLRKDALTEQLESKHEICVAVESDSEFLDCETTFSKNESIIIAGKETEGKDLSPATNVHGLDVTKDMSFTYDNTPSVNPPVLSDVTGLSCTNEEHKNNVTEPSDFSDFSKETNEILNEIEIFGNKLTSNEEVTHDKIKALENITKKKELIEKQAEPLEIISNVSLKNDKQEQKIKTSYSQDNLLNVTGVDKQGQNTTIEEQAANITQPIKPETLEAPETNNIITYFQDTSNQGNGNEPQVVCDVTRDLNTLSQDILQIVPNQDNGNESQLVCDVTRDLNTLSQDILQINPNQDNGNESQVVYDVTKDFDSHIIKADQITLETTFTQDLNNTKRQNLVDIDTQITQLANKFSTIFLTSTEQDTLPSEILNVTQEAIKPETLDICDTPKLEEIPDQKCREEAFESSETSNGSVSATLYVTQNLIEQPETASVIQIEKQYDIPLPNEDDIVKEIITGEVLAAIPVETVTVTPTEMLDVTKTLTELDTTETGHKDLLDTAVGDKIGNDLITIVLNSASPKSAVVQVDEVLETKNTELKSEITNTLDNKPLESLPECMIGNEILLPEHCNITSNEMGPHLPSEPPKLTTKDSKSDVLENIEKIPKTVPESTTSDLLPENFLQSSNMITNNETYECVLNDSSEIDNDLQCVTNTLNATATKGNFKQASKIQDIEPMYITMNENLNQSHNLPDLLNQTDVVTEENAQIVIATNTIEITKRQELAANSEKAEIIAEVEITLKKNELDTEDKDNYVNDSKTNTESVDLVKTTPRNNESIDDISQIMTTSLPTTNDNKFGFALENTLADANKLDMKPCDDPPSETIIGYTPDVENMEAKVITVDEEIIVSEMNSPYVSLMAGVETVPQKIEESFEEIQNSFVSNSNIPSSPPITSKGYNFNFDEMDDPFATKTKTNISPPLDDFKAKKQENEKTKSFEATKRGIATRRKSQPVERKKTSVMKKKFNITFDDNSVCELSPQKIDTTINDMKDKLNTKETTKSLDTTPILQEEHNKSESKENQQEGSEKQVGNTIKKSDTSLESSEENKSSMDSISNMSNDNKTTSSSEQSIYYTAGTSSTDSFKSKNVFNLPEIDDINFNPFATKSKMKQPPTPDLEVENPFATRTKIRNSPDTSMIVTSQISPNSTVTIDESKLAQLIEKVDTIDKMEMEPMEKETSSSMNNITASKTMDHLDLTTQEVNTEDEDTIEGPFLEVDDVMDKLSDFDAENVDMLQFNDVPVQAVEDNMEEGELFIDAEAYEFLLNQKSNVVADSGKESLFLKYDPLFAQRISSVGVLEALSKVQKRQSTPTKPAQPSLKNELSPIAGPSLLNITYEGDTNESQESNEDVNMTVSKPMMVVTPAVNPAVTPRNKSVPLTRPNRRSITFTSPAIAVIDRLLSMSANNSFMGQDTTITQAYREQTEADLALAQLRELLAEKEICVYDLRSESKELKDRLLTMESQVRILEADGQVRLNKINKLNERLVEKAKINKSMAAVVEEYERTIASLIAETEQDKKRNAEERIRLINERDEQTAHLASMEVSFSDLHSKYEKSKQVIIACKANEETYRKSIKDFNENLTKMQANYEMLKQHATSKLNHANQELEKMNRAHESEVVKLHAMIKRKDLHITSLEETLAQKAKANEELTAICDELINKVG